jgi:protein gp37
VHLGVSVEDQKTFDERVPLLLRTPAAVRWVSLEPLLAPIILDDVGGGGHTALTVEIDHPEDTRLDWVVCGGESGPGARPTHPEWIRKIRDDCQRAGVAFFLKQRGEWLPAWEAHDLGIRDGKLQRATIDGHSRIDPSMEITDVMLRVGKKAAGRELDGRTWDEFPEVTDG